MNIILWLLGKLIDRKTKKFEIRENKKKFFDDILKRIGGIYLK
jgi:hypothetical protein